MRKKTWVYLGVVLLVLVPLAAQQGNVLQPRSSVTVYDSKGKTVGTMIDASLLVGGLYPTPAPTVAFKNGQQIVIVGVRPDHFIGTEQFIVFGTADCSGTPYFFAPGTGPSLIPPSIVGNDGTVYASVSGSPETVYILALMLSGELDPASTCQSYENGDTQVLEARAVGNLASQYQPPFVLK